VFEEGKAYYVSNAQVKAVRDRKFNLTSHNYELSLNQNTVVNECRTGACNQLPKNTYKFVASIADVSQKAEKDVVDVLAVCSRVRNV
jgi:hypothetical protein